MIANMLSNKKHNLITELSITGRKLDDKISNKKLQYDINSEAKKYQHCHPVKFINMSIIQVKKYYPPNQSRVIEHS